MIRYRTALPEDRAFIVATWSSSYKNAHAAEMIASEDWPDVMHRAITKLLDRVTTRAIVAYEPEDESFVYGFIAGDTSNAVPIVYYVYVKAPYRSEPTSGTRSGPRHARGLFRALGVDPTSAFMYAAKTAVVTRIRDAYKIPRARFVPATARYTDYRQEPQDNEQR